MGRFFLIFRKITEEISNSSIDLSIYPNPASNSIVVQFLKSLNDISIELYDNFGKLILTKYLVNVTNGQKIELDISLIDSGIYYLNIPNMDNYEKKIIKN